MGVGSVKGNANGKKTEDERPLHSHKSFNQYTTDVGSSAPDTGKRALVLGEGIHANVSSDDAT